MKNTLRRIGFSAAATDEIVDTQGFDAISEFKLLTDSEVVNLCAIIRKPGGSVGSGTRQVPNPGVQVSLKAENNLKLMVFYIRHYLDRIDRPITPEMITQEEIRRLADLKEAEKAVKNLIKCQLLMLKIGLRLWRQSKTTSAWF